MANDEHVALLKQGVAAWNKWRDENANIRPNLNEGEPPRREPQRRESERGGPDAGEPERTAESGLRHRLNLSLRGPRNDDRSRERSINVALRETEIFRPSKAGAIVGSVHRRALRGQAEGKGANRTARPDHERGSSDPMCRPPLYAGHRGMLCLDGQSVPLNRYRRIRLRHLMPDHLLLVHSRPIYQS